MALNTSINLRNMMIYQMFVRQFSKTHDFKGAIAGLDRIKEMNTDIIYLLPINSIGKLNRKGRMGSPYSISNYYEVNPDLGTLDDFKNFVSEIHQRNMKVMIDIVFNHTSHDAVYTKTHPEWYYHKEDGSFANRVGDWWDITDFNFENNPELIEELINVLKYWTNFGVDGFRCDVAPLLPITFWKTVRSELGEINPDLIFLSESVHLSFIKYLRDLGYDAFSDSEMYQAFDICYDYDIFDDFLHHFSHNKPISRWVDGLIRQESTYPKNYIKLRFLENHDQERLAKYLKTDSQIRNVNCMLFFLKGTPMIYNGQECAVKNRPDLFEIDEINWENYNYARIVDIIKKMSSLKKRLDYINWIMNIRLVGEDVIEIKYEKGKQNVVGIFNLSENPREIVLEYEGNDYLRNVIIEKGKQFVQEPIVLVNE